jgi:hypothetical protein
VRGEPTKEIKPLIASVLVLNSHNKMFRGSLAGGIARIG